MLSREVLDRVADVTARQLTIEHKNELLVSTVEELGEYARAIAVESGSKTGVNLDESSKMEAIDLILCALSLYYAEGGTTGNFEADLDKKLRKWEDMIDKTIKRKRSEQNNWLKQANLHELVDGHENY